MKKIISQVVISEDCTYILFKRIKIVKILYFFAFFINLKIV